MALLEGDTPIKEPFWEGKGWGEDLLGVNACVIATAALQITSDIESEFFLGFFMPPVMIGMSGG